MNILLEFVRNPVNGVKEAMNAKKWLTVFLILIAATAVVSYLTAPISRADQIQMFKNSPMAEKMTDEQLAQMERPMTPTGRIMGAVSGAVMGGIALLLASCFLFLFYNLGGVKGLFVQFLAAVCTASLMDMLLGGLVRTVLILMKGTSLVSTGLTLLLPNLEVTSFAFMFLYQFDLFAILYIVVLALGVAVFSGIKPGKSMGLAFSYFLFKALLIAGVSTMMMKMFSGMGR